MHSMSGRLDTLMGGRPGEMVRGPVGETRRNKPSRSWKSRDQCAEQLHAPACPHASHQDTTALKSSEHTLPWLRTAEASRVTLGACC